MKGKKFEKKCICSLLTKSSHASIFAVGFLMNTILLSEILLCVPFFCVLHEKRISQVELPGVTHFFAKRKRMDPPPPDMGRMAGQCGSQDRSPYYACRCPRGPPDFPKARSASHSTANLPKRGQQVANEPKFSNILHPGLRR